MIERLTHMDPWVLLEEDGHAKDPHGPDLEAWVLLVRKTH
jgi:hypothetical protein